MERPTGFRWSKVVPGLAIVLVVGAIFWFSRQMDPGNPAANANWPTKYVDVPAITTARTVTADSASLAPAARVLGVSIGDWHRAYPLERLSKSRSHIVNDVLDGQAFSVAYCDRTDCARLFKKPGHSGPLDLAVGGWFNEDGSTDMLIRVGPNRYRLKSGDALDPAAPAFPYEAIEIETTTWHAWRTAHPTTDVFLEAIPVGLLN